MDSLTDATKSSAEPSRVSETNLNFTLPRDVKDKVVEIAWQRRISVAEYMRSILYKELNIQQ